ncbi:MAG: MoaD/ThiS family protein [Mariprofundus sp.]|nr:MoaD/ThiS family protein [Mariprofundus sp.]
MTIRVLFFGMIAAKLGRHEWLLPISHEITLAEVIEQVGCSECKPLLLAVNQQQVKDRTTIIRANDEVAIMPPFAGG